LRKSVKKFQVSLEYYKDT